MTFEEEWARCGPWLEAALALTRGTHSLEDVRRAVETGECRLYTGRASALVCEMQDWPQRKVLLLWLAGGDLAELRDELRPLAERWGREQGCTHVSIIGRPGWARALPEYEQIAVVCGKEL